MVAVPTVIMGAYKERESIFKTIIYVLAFAMLIYLLWKIFKAFEKLGKLDDAIKEGISDFVNGLKEGVEEVKKYGITKPVTPSETAEIITKRASKEPDKPYYVEKSIYDALKEQGHELPENVKPKVNVPKSKYYEEEKKEPVIGSYTGIGDLGAYKRALEKTREEEKKKEEVKPKTIKEHMELEGKRWEAKADYYQRKLHLIEGLDSNRYYKLTWIDNKGLRHERIMKGSEIEAERRDIYKVISILPMPTNYKPKSTPLPIRIKPIIGKEPIRHILPVERPIRAI